jgi:hypothetical protein
MYGDGGSRTHVQRYRHLSFYERSRYIVNSRTMSAYRLASLIASLISLFPLPRTAELGVAHLVRDPNPTTWAMVVGS